MIICILLAPIIAALISLLVKRKMSVLETLTLLSTATVLGLSIFVARDVFLHQHYTWSSYFSIGAFGAISLLLISFISFLASVYSTGYLRAEVKKEIIGFSRVRQYYIFFNLFLVAMILAVTSVSPIITWVAVEATTLSTVFLISFYNKTSSTEAAWKYLIINSVGLLLAFFGTMLFLSSSISLATAHSFITWNDLLANADHFDPAIAKIAFIFIIIGYGTKLGLVPMHTWLPDAHSKAPVPISSLLSGVLLNIALFTILRFKIVADIAIGSNFTGGLFIYFGLFSILISALLIYRQINYKRLLAYSTIEHMGIICFGIGLGGVAFFAALLHMVYHSLAKPLLFLASGNIFLKYSSTKIEKIRGALQALPLTSVLFFIGLLVITGVPPFGIFITEFSILTEGIKAQPALTVVALFALVLIFVGFLKHGSSMLFGEKPETIPVGENSGWNLVPLFILALVLIGLSFYLPNSLKTLLERATLVY